MNTKSVTTLWPLATALIFSGCAGNETTFFDAPKISLARVELQDASLSRQTFLLGFDVSNPNPFPLPVRAVKYRVLFDDKQFAGGETEGRFTIPARGHDAFAISVDLDLLGTATDLATLLRGSMPEDVSYQLDGSLTVDIPFSAPIPFSSTGVVRVPGYRY